MLDAKFLLKVENASNPGISFEKEATGTVANAWEELTFDYSTINVSNQYQNLVFIFDLVQWVMVQQISLICLMMLSLFNPSHLTLLH